MKACRLKDERTRGYHDKRTRQREDKMQEIVGRKGKRAIE
jgi:hypothetical protein